MSIKEAVEQIEQDFREGREPFDSVTFPEQRLLDEVVGETIKAMEDRMIFVSMFATFDYNRDANQLVDNIIELWNESWWAFDTKVVALHENEDGLSDVLEDIGFRYPNRDAAAWKKNCDILSQKYNGFWTELLLDVGANAKRLVNRLEADDFSCLKGDKIAPMYARIINDEIVELDDVWELDISVDTHIRRLSKDLFNAPDKNDDWIRREWRGLAVTANISRHVVDGGLWHIGNKWDEWGEEYWNEVNA